MSEVASWLDTIGRVFHAVPDLATPEQVESALREILDDSELRLYWWDWEQERYVDVAGRPVEPTGETGQALTRVEYESRKIGALVHDARMLEVQEFTDSFVPLLRIAMERDRLHRDLVSKLEELNASRLRIVRAGDEERRRLERNLHDGAQQHLTAALLALRSLAAKLEGDPELERLADGARAELAGAIDELREIARGLHPPLLAREGLAAALRAGAARASLPVELDVRLQGSVLRPEIEAAAYYVCAEAVTNAIKHAEATQVWISAAHDDGALIVIVRDDGIGGACFDCNAEATGLGGLADRVEALGGTFELHSPKGEGTRLTATFPAHA
jgi:signal transduction histidine kinase